MHGCPEAFKFRGLSKNVLYTKARILGKTNKVSLAASYLVATRGTGIRIRYVDGGFYSCCSINNKLASEPALFDSEAGS